MIIYLNGQPGSGKTTLSLALKNSPLSRLQAFCIDGDIMRDLTGNKNYGISGRMDNITFAHKLAMSAHAQGFDVILSLVSPYEGLREDFKAMCKEQHIPIVIVHLHYDKEKLKRGKEDRWCEVFEKGNSIDTFLDTGEFTVQDCIDFLMQIYINKP